MCGFEDLVDALELTTSVLSEATDKFDRSCNEDSVLAFSCHNKIIQEFLQDVKPFNLLNGKSATRRNQIKTKLENRNGVLTTSIKL